MDQHPPPDQLKDCRVAPGSAVFFVACPFQSSSIVLCLFDPLCEREEGMNENQIELGFGVAHKITPKVSRGQQLMQWLHRGVFSFRFVRGVKLALAVCLFHC